jgi:hypothetical protein
MTNNPDIPESRAAIEAIKQFVRRQTQRLRKAS